ncbi:MAG: TonB-dependent receptor [Kofleriaceae bacterium]
MSPLMRDGACRAPARARVRRASTSARVRHASPSALLADPPRSAAAGAREGAARRGGVGPRRARHLRLALAGALLALAARAHADPRPASGEADSPEPTPPLAAATSARVGRAALEEHSAERLLDLLRLVPGLHPLQVGGGSEAEQLLLRGLDARQGLELEIFVDGVPLNAVGPGRDHGAADTQVVIPRALAELALVAGPYAARYGAHATTGALELRTLDELPGGGAEVHGTSSLELTRGVRRRARRLAYGVTGLASPRLAAGRGLIAVDVGITDGPFVHPQRMRRGAVLGKWSQRVGGGTWRTTATLFSGRGGAPGLVPTSERSGSSLDATLGASSTRASLGSALELRDADGHAWHLDASATRSSRRRFRDATLFLLDPVEGDQREEVLRDTQLSLHGWYGRARQLGCARNELRLGVQGRTDAFASESWHTAARRRLASCGAAGNPCARADGLVSVVSVYAEDTLALDERLTVSAGARLDQHTWVVEETTATGAESRDTARARFHPKLGVSFQALPTLELLAMAGGGARASDPVVAAQTDALRALPRIWAAELGVRWRRGTWLAAAVSAHAARRGAELVRRDEHDPGAAARGDLVDVAASTTVGLDGWIAATPRPWLTVDGSLSLARSRRAGAPVPQAPRVFGAAGVTVRRAALYASIRGVGIGARPLAAAAATEPTRSTAAQALVTATLGARWRGLAIGLTLDNALDASWQEEQDAYPLRVDPADEVGVAHVRTPGRPLTALLTVGYGG